MICPNCGCDSFQEAYSEDTVMFFKNFCCPACGCVMPIAEGKITAYRVNKHIHYLAIIERTTQPYLNKFVKQYNNKFYGK